MKAKVSRLFEVFYTFVNKEKTRNFFAFIFYVLCIITLTKINLPPVVKSICMYLVVLVSVLGLPIYTAEWMDKIWKENRERPEKSIIKELKKIGKEILMFIPFYLMSALIVIFFAVDKPANQTEIESTLYKSSISKLIFVIILAPIIEEFIFRFLPAKFIKDKYLYIAVSSFIFAGMHVFGDPNPFYYIKFYIPISCYYGYRYYQTKDILVSISLHSFHNLIAMLTLILS